MSSSMGAASAATGTYRSAASSHIHANVSNDGEEASTQDFLATLGVQAVEQQHVDQDMARRAWIKHMCQVDTCADWDTVKTLKEETEAELSKERKLSKYASDRVAQLMVQLRILERLEHCFLQQSSGNAPGGSSSGNQSMITSPDGAEQDSFFGVLQQDSDVRLGYKTPFEVSRERQQHPPSSTQEEGEIPGETPDEDLSPSIQSATSEKEPPLTQNKKRVAAQKDSAVNRKASRRAAPSGKALQRDKAKPKEPKKKQRTDDQTLSSEEDEFAEYEASAELQVGGSADDDEDNAMDLTATVRDKDKHVATRNDEINVADPMVATIEDDSDYAVYRERIEKFESLCSEKPELHEEQDVSGWVVPKNIWNNLFPYQKTGVRWLIELHRHRVGGVIADEMGLGKTVQVAVFLCALKLQASNSSNQSSSLIVCPATMLTHWYRELIRWYPPLRVLVMHQCSVGMKALGLSAKRIASMAFAQQRNWKNKCDAVVMTYEGFRRNADMLASLPWQYVILDEGHKIRNPATDIATAVKTVPTVHRLILSGAPIQNKLLELWSLFDFVFPGRLGSQEVFEEQFAKPIAAGGWANATRLQASRAYQCAVILRDLIRPYLLRRMKKDVHDQSILPPKTEQVLFCRLSGYQRELYKKYLDSLEVSQVLKGEARAFRALGLLRKLCNHPDLFKITEDPYPTAFYERRANADDEGDGCGPMNTMSDRIASGRTNWKRSGKLTVTSKILEQWFQEGHRVLLFTQGRQMLDVIEGLVQYHQFPYLRMDGTTPVIQRQQLIDRFNHDESEAFVFLLTTRVGGIGVNLTGANRVILYDPDWNPSTDTQARERAWRLGQRRHVTIYRLICRGTIEEKIYQRQVWKLLITTRVLQNPEAGGGYQYSKASGKQRRKSRKAAGIHTDELYDNSELRELFTLNDEDHTDGSKSQQQSLNNNVDAAAEEPSSNAVDLAAYVSEDEEDDEAYSDDEEASTDKAVMQALFNDSELDNVFENRQSRDGNVESAAARWSTDAAAALRQSNAVSEAQFHFLTSDRIAEILRSLSSFGRGRTANEVSNTCQQCWPVFGRKRILRRNISIETRSGMRASVASRRGASFLIGSSFNSGGSRQFAPRSRSKRMKVSQHLYKTPHHLSLREESPNSRKGEVLTSSDILQRMHQRHNAVQQLEDAASSSRTNVNGGRNRDGLWRAASRQDSLGRTFTSMVDLSRDTTDKLSPSEERVKQCGCDIIRFLRNRRSSVETNTVLEHFQGSLQVPPSIFRRVLRTVAEPTSSSRRGGRKVWKLRRDFRNSPSSSA
eukprot:gb/GECG01006528.1/.p1 GENE.gb/GECG01006528.1/~~gb/GECG01006528.1/.p1  ORF type:complete len:1296 (+),score=186.76 gb/GECG01006528.1/:1-3888(+)